jgi:hypothetical protein
MTDFGRNLTFIDQILFVDGTSGAGKSVINSIIPCFENVEIPIWDAFYETISLIYECDKIDKDSAVAFMGTLAETRLYDASVGRHTNFRFRDSTSIFHNPNFIDNITRIIKEDGDLVIEKIKKEKRILTIGSHHLLSFPSLVFEAFKDKLKIVEMIRHPSSVIKFWIERRWPQRMGSDPRDFSLWSKYDEVTLPWYTVGFEDDYMRMNDIEKIINGIKWINDKRIFQMNKLGKEKNKLILSIPFEHFITQPMKYIDRLSNFISKNPTNRLKKFMKKAKIPRLFNSDDIQDQTDKIMNMKMNTDTKKIFINMCDDYNQKLQIIMEIK